MHVKGRDLEAYRVVDEKWEISSPYSYSIALETRFPENGVVSYDGVSVLRGIFP